MSLSNGHPADAIELAPSVPPLADAITEAEHDAQVAEEERLVSLHRRRLLSCGVHTPAGRRVVCRHLAMRLHIAP